MKQLNNIEIWKDIEGYEGYYQVSNFGNVKSLSRDIVKSNEVIQHRKERLLTKRKNSDGYYSVHLCVDKEEKNIGIHILVAKAFVPNPNNKKEVNHNDFNRANNKASNLSWMTHKENVNYTINAGRHYCNRDLTGNNNPNYNNHILSEKYLNNKELSKEKQSRPDTQNGRATKIKLLDKDRNFIKSFDLIKWCAEYLISNNYTSAKLSSVTSNISSKLDKDKTYLNFYYVRY